MPKDVSDIGYTEMAPVMFDLQTTIDRYLPKSAEKAWVFLDSTALAIASSASIRALPYAIPGGVAKLLKINDVFHCLSTRLLYVEASLMVGASLVHNFVCSIFYTGLMLMTLGVSRTVNYSCRRHWAHTGYALMSSLITVSGIVFPLLGVALNKWFVTATLYSLKDNYKGDLALFEEAFIPEVKELYSSYETLFRDLARNKAGDRYDEEYRPGLNYISRRIEMVENMDDLLDLVADVWRKFPDMTGTHTREPTNKWFWSKWSLPNIWRDRSSPAAHAHYE